MDNKAIPTNKNEVTVGTTVYFFDVMKEYVNGIEILVPKFTKNTVRRIEDDGRNKIFYLRRDADDYIFNELAFTKKDAFEKSGYPSTFADDMVKKAELTLSNMKKFQKAWNNTLKGC